MFIDCHEKWATARRMFVPSSTTPSPKRSERGAQLGSENLRLFKRREVATFLKLVVVHQLGISPFGPIARDLIDLVRKNAYSNRDFDPFDTEVGEFVFPVEACSGKRRVRQP